jgi:hypothetical protein
MLLKQCGDCNAQLFMDPKMGIMSKEKDFLREHQNCSGIISHTFSLTMPISERVPAEVQLGFLSHLLHNYTVIKVVSHEGLSCHL